MRVSVWPASRCSNGQERPLEGMMMPDQEEKWKYDWTPGKYWEEYLARLHYALKMRGPSIGGGFINKGGCDHTDAAGKCDNCTI